MNRSDMRTLFYGKIQETSSNSMFSSTLVNLYLQEAWYKIYTWKNTVWDWLVTETNITMPYTTVSSSSTGTTLNVTSNSNFVAGQYIHVKEGNVVERVRIQTVATGVLTLVSPGLVNTYTTAATVHCNYIAVPTGLMNFLTLTNIKTTEDDVTTNNIERTDWRTLQEKSPLITNIGAPQYYTVKNGYMIFSPLPDYAYKINISYLKMGTDLADETSPELPVQYHKYIVDYAIAVALKSNVNNQILIQLGSLYESEFYNGLNLIKSNNTYLPDVYPKIYNKSDEIDAFCLGG